MVAEVTGMSKRLYVMETLDDLLLEAINETLKVVFREAGAEAIYGYLENNSHLRREEIAEKPEVFSASLERLLGSGASVVEQLILKDLYSRLELRLKWERGYEFSDHIRELREKFGCQKVRP